MLDVATWPPVDKEEEVVAEVAPKVLPASMLVCWLSSVGVESFMAVDV